MSGLIIVLSVLAVICLIIWVSQSANKRKNIVKGNEVSGTPEQEQVKENSEITEAKMYVENEDFPIKILYIEKEKYVEICTEIDIAMRGIIRRFRTKSIATEKSIIKNGDDIAELTAEYSTGTKLSTIIKSKHDGIYSEFSTRIDAFAKIYKGVFDENDNIFSVTCLLEEGQNQIDAQKKEDDAVENEKKRKELKAVNEKNEIRGQIIENERKKNLKKQVFNELVESGIISNESSNEQNREPIPKEVMNQVWNRDGGACVICGSRENLEFHHIIPVSKGGATTYRNLQILCQKCNREKSNKI